MRKGWKIGILCVAILLILPAVVLPLREQLRENAYTRRVVTQLLRRMEEMAPEKQQRQRNLAKWYNRNLTSREPEPSFRAAYGGILDLGEGMMGILTIPEMDLSLPISHGEGGAVGHDPNSAFPIGGRGNHTVLNLREDQLRRLPEPGDTVRITTLGTSMAYRIESVQIMSAGWPVDRENSEGDFLTLVVDGRTGLSRTRVLIRCARSETLEIQEQGKTKAAFAWVLPAVCIPALAVKPLVKLRGKHIYAAQAEEKSRE